MSDPRGGVRGELSRGGFVSGRAVAPCRGVRPVRPRTRGSSAPTRRRREALEVRRPVVGFGNLSEQMAESRHVVGGAVAEDLRNQGPGIAHPRGQPATSPVRVTEIERGGGGDRHDEADGRGTGAAGDGGVATVVAKRRLIDHWRHLNARPRAVERIAGSLTRAEPAEDPTGDDPEISARRARLIRLVRRSSRALERCRTLAFEPGDLVSGVVPSATVASTSVSAK